MTLFQYFIIGHKCTVHCTLDAHGHWFGASDSTNSANKLFAQLSHFGVNFFGLSGRKDPCIKAVPPVLAADSASRQQRRLSDWQY
mmetsp:Transcript_23491/g.46772  ORF Transcript_23491/g.46772 Transcript_23491/m.46772 type:complete len:85 (-) Transcript_23491:125-379(-)